jgi:hypothetical protein
MIMRGSLGAAICAGLCGLGLACGAAAALDSEIGADMPGRWRLLTPTGTYCILEFSGAANIPHGIVTTTGFCPAIFAAHPKWWLDAGQVVVGRRRRPALAVFAPVWRGELEGRALTGEMLTLTR